MFFDLEKQPVHKEVLQAVADSGGGNDALIAALTAISKHYSHYHVFLWLTAEEGLVPVYPNRPSSAYELLNEKVNAFYQNIDAQRESSSRLSGKKTLYVCSKLYDSDKRLIGILFVEHIPMRSLRERVSEAGGESRFAEIEELVECVLRVILPGCQIDRLKARANPLALPFIESYDGDKTRVRAVCLIRPRDIDELLETYGSNRVYRLVSKWREEAEHFFENVAFYYGENYGFLIVSEGDPYAFSVRAKEFAEKVERLGFRDVVEHDVTLVHASSVLIICPVDEKGSERYKKFDQVLNAANRYYYYTNRKGVVFVGDYIAETETGSVGGDTEVSADTTTENGGDMGADSVEEGAPEEQTEDLEGVVSDEMEDDPAALYDLFGGF